MASSTGTGVTAMPPSFLTYEEQHAGALQNLQQHQYQQKQKQSQAVEDVLPPKKRLKPTKSNVWSFFEKRCVGGQALAFCIVDGCPKKDGYKCGSTTSPMLKHMRDQHPTLWNAGPRAATVGTVGTLVAAPSGLVVKAVKWLVMSNMPLTTFDDKYWREMVCWMNSRASSITRAAVEECLDSVEVTVRNTVSEMVKDQRLSCSADVWHSMNNESFMSLTGHYINSSWELKSLCLECAPIPETQPGGAMSRKMDEVLNRSGVRLELVEAIVAENGVSGGDGFPGNYATRRNSCLAHTLDLVASKILDTPLTCAGLTGARRLVTDFKYSPLATDELNKVAAAMGVKPRALRQDDAIRWSSTFTLCSALKHMKPALQAMVLANKVSQHLTAVQWEAIEDCVKVLQPFAEAQSFLDGESFVHFAYVPSIVTNLRHHLDDIVSNAAESEAVRGSALVVRSEFYKSYFGLILDAEDATSTQADGKMPESALLAAQVDPRTKFLLGIGEKDSERARELLEEQMIARQRYVADREASAAAASVGGIPEGTGNEKEYTEGNMEGRQGERGQEVLGDDELPSKNAYIQRMLAKLVKRSASGAAPGAGGPAVQVIQAAAQTPAELDAVHGAQRRAELRVFLNPLLCPAIAETDDPLTWWKTRAEKFPLVAHVARGVLATPATSAPSEPLFSQNGMIVASKRDRLQADRLEQLAFLRGSWVSTEEYRQQAALQAMPHKTEE